MLNIHRTSQFKKDYKRAIKSGKPINLLVQIIEKLANQETYKDHNLSGNYANFRECHIQTDWLLIYKYDEETLYLTRLGSHSDLF